MRAQQTGRKPATERPPRGRRGAMPRPPSDRKVRPSTADTARRKGRVNQKMINGMVKMRTEGFTHAQIAERYGVSQRTSRRHTEGVSPQLVHAGDQAASVNLLAWGAEQLRAIQHALRLSVAELNLGMRRWRDAVFELDDLTIDQLQHDAELRRRFLLTEVWPGIHEKIDGDRAALDIPTTPLPPWGFTVSSDPKDFLVARRVR